MALAAAESVTFTEDTKLPLNTGVLITPCNGIVSIYARWYKNGTVQSHFMGLTDLLLWVTRYFLGMQFDGRQGPEILFIHLNMILQDRG
mgnify:FL=1